MKGLLKYIIIALALPMLAIGCTTDYPEPNEALLPSASEFDVQIDIDQESNYVTFTLKNPGMVPMWIFGDVKIDTSDNKKYAYTDNGVTLRFREQGVHTVEVKAYNQHGISIGSKVYEFYMENEYRDAFNAAPYMKAMSNTWMWNSEADGHFGCGEVGSDGKNWWSCPANGKDGMGLYDDNLTFDAEGNYTYNPGEGGTVYVNWGLAAQGYYPEYYNGDEQDYQAPIEGYTKGYRLEQVWNDAGIEEIYLILESGANLSYIPHMTALNEGRYRFVDCTVAGMKKALKLINEAPNENNGGGISWYYEFVPAVHKATPEELLAGTDAAGKVWIMDNMAAGHLACGESVENPTGWWSASANEKADFGLYDNELTFTPANGYIFNPGPDGEIFVNMGCTSGVVPGATDGAAADYDMAWSVQEGTYTFDGTTLTLPEGFTVGYLPFDELYTNPVFTVTEITETALTLVCYTATGNGGGPIAWQLKFKARDVQAPAVTFAGEDLSSGICEVTLAQGEEIAVSGVDFENIWVDPDFFTVVNDTTLKFNAMSGDYRVMWDEKWFKVIPLNANGEKATYADGALWIIGDGGGKPTVDNLIGWNTGEAPLPLARISENTYRITLAMKCEGGSIKVFGQSDWGIEWKKENYGTVTGNGLFHIPGEDGNIHTDGAEQGYYTFTFTDNGGTLDMEVKKAKFGDQTIYDPAYEGNMWLNCNVLEMTYYYAPGWAQIANPGFEELGTNHYKITLPEATTDQWQAQVAFKTDMTTSADKSYDFYLEMTSTMNHPGVTIKLVLDGDDNTFYFADRHELVEYETFVYKVPNMPGIDMSKINLFFDFGGCAAGTEVEIKNILLQEHREAE